MKDSQQNVIAIHDTIRGVEVDVTGVVSAGWLTRLFDRGRWKVSTRDGAAFRKQMERSVARAIILEYNEPLRYGEEVEIVTWVARVGRTSFDFDHRITRCSDQAIAARARMTAVNLGRGGPSPIDPMIATLVVNEPTPAIRRWTASDRAQSWKRQWIISPSDHGHSHVNFARYVDFLDDTRWFAAQAGAPAGLKGRFETLSVEYLREAHAGDRVQMETWVTGKRTRAYELTRQPSAEVLARGHIAVQP